MDRDFEELNRKMEKVQEELMSTQVEFRVLKGNSLYEKEQLVEHRTHLSEIDSELRTCQLTNGRVVKMIIKLQNIIDDLNAKIEVLKESVVTAQKSQCELDNNLDQQMESKNSPQDTEDLIDDSASFRATFEKAAEENISHLVRINSLDKEDCSQSNTETIIEFKQIVRRAPQIKILTASKNFVWKIPNIWHQISSSTCVSDYSPCFCVCGFPFSAQAIFSIKDDIFSLCIFFMPEESLNALAPSYLLIPRVHLTFKNRSKDRHQDLVRSGSFCFGTKLTTMKFSFRSLLVLNYSFIKNDAVTMKIHVEAPGVTNQAHSRDGTLMWVINNYDECLASEMRELSEFQLSPYFYTTARGYRVQAAAYLNGEGRYRWHGLSVRISFLMGEFDEELAPFFMHSTSITMGDKANPQTKYPFKAKSYVMGSDNSSFVINLWDHSLVKQFLVGDSLILQIEIKK